MGMPTPGIETAINAKIRVLRDFCVVDDENESAIRNKLVGAVRDSRSSDYDRVLDCVARKLIAGKLGREW